MYLLKYTYSSLIFFIFFGQLYSQNPISIKDSLDIMKVMDIQENMELDSLKELSKKILKTKKIMLHVF